MSRKFKLWTDPYDTGIKLFKKKNIEINLGVTVLVGCNGIGKSTMLHCIRDQLRNSDIPYLYFDNLKDGGSNAISEAGFRNDYSFMTSALASSEGERISQTLGRLARRMGDLVRAGIDDGVYNPFAKVFEKCEENEGREKNLPDERWIILDAVDSGFSVDNVIELKEELFKTILEHNCGKEIYILVSANAYEMANGENCFDVYNGKYITFQDYDDYRDFIIESRNEKKKREEIAIEEE